MSPLALFAGKRLAAYAAPVAIVALIASHGWAYHKGAEKERTNNAVAQAKAERVYLEKLQQRITENTALADQYREDREHADQSYQAALDEIERQRRRADAVRLRDPGKTACRPALPAPPGPAGGVADTATRNDISAAVDGVLSPAATRFLLDFAADADRAAAYAIACHGWVRRTQ